MKFSSSSIVPQRNTEVQRKEILYLLMQTIQTFVDFQEAMILNMNQFETISQRWQRSSDGSRFLLLQVRFCFQSLEVCADCGSLVPTPQPDPLPISIIPNIQTTHFIGRASIFRQLDELFDTSSVPRPKVALWGMGGVGSVLKPKNHPLADQSLGRPSVQWNIVEEDSYN